MISGTFFVKIMTGRTNNSCSLTFNFFLVLTLSRWHITIAFTFYCFFFCFLPQNAEDNDYLEGVEPSLEFVITSRDITATGAPATLLIFNNESGFTPRNIDSICSVGRSTKKGNRRRGYIGEKGLVTISLSHILNYAGTHKMQ